MKGGKGKNNIPNCRSLQGTSKDGLQKTRKPVKNREYALRLYKKQGRRVGGSVSTRRRVVQEDMLGAGRRTGQTNFHSRIIVSKKTKGQATAKTTPKKKKKRGCLGDERQDCEKEKLHTGQGGEV